MSQVTLPMVYRSLGFSLLLSAIIFGISYAVYRSSRKAGIFTTIFIVGFFVYGFIYNQLELLFYKDLWPFAHIHRFLVIAYSLFYLVLFLVFYRSRRPHHNVNYALNVFVIGVFVLNALMGMSSSKRTGRMDTAANPFIGSLQQGIADSVKGLPRPDVYYIILDGYAGEAVLRQFYGSNYTGFYSCLRNHGFYIADSSRTNYPFTSPSLSSSLNAQYIDSVDAKRRQTLITQNLVSYIFKKGGYRVVDIESGYAVTAHLTYADKTIDIKGLNEFENRILELTILRLDDVLGFTNHLRLKSQLDRLPLMAKEKGPKFGFVHIVSPHPPFVVDSMGNRHLRNSLSDMAWEPRQDYAQQLQYVSKRVMELITLLQKDKANPPLIILQSDHGPWLNSTDPKEVYEARSQILNAYFVPPAYRAKLYPTITPVNSFRLLFSELFKLDLPLLPDRPVSYDYFLSDPTFKKYAD